MQLLKKWCDVVVLAPQKNKSCSGVEYRLQSAQLVGCETDECRIAKVKSLQTPPWTASPAWKQTADLAECGKAVRHGLRNMRPQGGVRVKVDSQAA